MIWRALRPGDHVLTDDGLEAIVARWTTRPEPRLYGEKPVSRTWLELVLPDGSRRYTTRSRVREPVKETR